MDLDDDDDDVIDPSAGLSRAERVRLRAARREREQRILAENPNHPTIEHIVDNRVFLLGLDELYRRRMKRHESTELLACARAVAAELNVPPADVPIEGYYAETRRLAEYFRLVRGLRAVPNTASSRVARMPELRRLMSVMSAPLFGRPVGLEQLLPVGRDPLSQALVDIGDDPSQLTVGTLAERAARVALETDDFSLVGLASISRDPVVLAALRESVVLYAEFVTMSRESLEPPVHLYLWQVDEELTRRAARFVATFNQLFDDDLPEPVAENADLFFNAAAEEDIIGRCVCIAGTPPPARFYHWAIARGPDGRPVVEEFWDSEIWTTERYARRTGSDP